MDLFHGTNLLFGALLFVLPLYAQLGDEHPIIAEIRAQNGIVSYGKDEAGNRVIDIDFWFQSKIDKNDFPALNRLPNIRSINLSGSKVSGESLRMIRGLKYLQK